MTPNPLPGLSIEKISSSTESESSKRKTAPESTNVNTNAKRPKLNISATDEPANDASGLITITDNLDTVIRGVTEHLSTMKLLLSRGHFSDVEELAKQGPGLLKRLQVLQDIQKGQVAKNAEKRKEMDEAAAAQEKVRMDREESLRTQLADSEAAQEAHVTALETLLRDISGVMVFRAMLNDEEVTVSFTAITKSQEAVVTVHSADRRKLVWHDNMDKCIASIKSWDWFLCLDQGPGRPGIHLHHVMEQDVVQLPTSLRRDTEWGTCYCREPGV